MNLPENSILRYYPRSFLLLKYDGKTTRHLFTLFSPRPGEINYPSLYLDLSLGNTFNGQYSPSGGNVSRGYQVQEEHTVDYSTPA